MEHLNGQTGTDTLVLEGPPRHGKTELCGKWLPSWYLGRYPDRHVGNLGYGAAIAKASSRRCRAIMRAYGPDWWGVRVSSESHAADEWHTTAGGSMRAVGVGGALTGFGLHLAILDDYLKNAEKALSPTVRQGQWDWYQSTVINRLEPGGKIIIMATRWHDDDLIGRIFKNAEERGTPVAHLKMPAIAEYDDHLGREPGTALWEERWPLATLLEKKSNMEPFWWLSQYQQRPSRHTSTEWPDAYFEDIIATEDEWPREFTLSAVGVDPSKGKTAKPGDYFASVFGGLARGTIWVESRMDRNRDLSNIVGGCIDWVYDGSHPVDGLGLESNTFQDLLEPEFERQCAERDIPPLPIHLIHNTEGKTKIRIPRIGPYLRRKQLKFRDTPGTRILVQQLKDHPFSDHDDGPDALEIMLRLLRHLASERDEEIEDDAPVDLEAV